MMAKAEATVKVFVLASPEAPELDVLSSNLPPGVEILAIGRTVEEAGGCEAVSEATVIACGGSAPLVPPYPTAVTDALRACPKLQWVHSLSAGVNHVLVPELAQSDIPLTNAKGVYSASLAEYAMGCCLYFAKDFPRLLAQKQEKKWVKFDVEMLAGRTFGVVGYGDIGRECARLARAFGMRVVALRRRVEMDDLGPEVEATYGPDQLPELMAASDYICAALPLTASTKKFVGAAAFGAMKPTGVFINIGRGATVDEAALVDALREERIKGAALDVTDTEPLPESSPLWGLDNVFLSPHNADQTKDYQRDSIRKFCTITRGFAERGREGLTNVVDKQSGY